MQEEMNEFFDKEAKRKHQEEFLKEYTESQEKEKQDIANQLGISIDQIETLSPEEQEAGAITQDQLNIAEEDARLGEKFKKDISDEEELRQFLASEENRQHALQLAEQIQQVCGDKWFTVDKLVKKSAESKQTAFQKLKLCEMFGMMAFRVGDWRDERKQLREQLFKVMISAKDKVEALDRIIAYHKDQIDKMTIDRDMIAQSIPKP